MTKMIKQVVSLTPQQVAWLRDESERLGLSIAEIARRAIDDYRDVRQLRHSPQEEEKTTPKK